MEESKWISCRESEPRELENGEVLLIAFCVEYDDGTEWSFWTYDKCPLGWNVLSRSDAWYRIIKAPSGNNKI